MTLAAPPRGGRLRAIVLGSAAGGGSPQWNCRCEVCRRVRAGEPGLASRTQSSLAVSADGIRWALIEASPDLPEQLRREDRLWPHGGRRSSPIGCVVLTDGDVDHVAGLLSLRERHPFGLYATRALLARLDASPVFDVLDRSLVERRPLPLEERVELRDGEHAPLGLWVRPFAVPGKVPLWAEADAPVVPDAIGEEVVGLEIGAGEASMFFIPSCAAVPPELAGRLRGARLVLFDGTVWEDDELRQAGLADKTGRRMGHLPVAGPGGSLEAFASLAVGRRIYVHVNNSNPLLLPDSPPRRAVEEGGWEVAEDGLELEVTG